MKLLTFCPPGGYHAHFGLVVGDRAVSFTALQGSRPTQHAPLRSMADWLTGWPASHDLAADLLVDARNTAAAGDAESCWPLASVRILPPLQPVALWDFGLAPRHLASSARTLLQREYGTVLRWLIVPWLRRRFARIRSGQPLPYYKGNHLAISGDGDTLHWPEYCSYLDIEPELALVTGGANGDVAGYTILNDVSARDVQWPEMLGLGLTRSKDFACSNGLGPFLVTADEVADPLRLAVQVRIGARPPWLGTTADYAVGPADLVRYLRTLFPLVPGMVLGMGTIPGCCGLDRDEWPCPGDRVEIDIEGLGTLRQRIPTAIGPLQPSRWGERAELRACYGAATCHETTASG